LYNKSATVLPRDDFPRWQDASAVFLLEQHPGAAVGYSNRQRNDREPRKFLREVQLEIQDEWRSHITSTVDRLCVNIPHQRMEVK